MEGEEVGYWWEGKRECVGERGGGKVLVGGCLSDGIVNLDTIRK